jgi:hypothetical protein
MIRSSETEAEAATTSQGRSDHPPWGFESRLRLGVSNVLHQRPELRDALPFAAMMDDSARWCA